MKRIRSTALIVIVVLATVLGAQTKSPATFADFGKWETLAPAGARGGFSPDGRWLAYAINRSNRENELRDRQARRRDDEDRRLRRPAGLSPPIRNGWPTASGNPKPSRKSCGANRSPCRTSSAC